MVDVEFLLPAVLVASLLLADVLFPLAGRVAEGKILSSRLLIPADFENLLLLIYIILNFNYLTMLKYLFELNKQKVENVIF